MAENEVLSITPEMLMEQIAKTLGMAVGTKKKIKEKEITTVVEKRDDVQTIIVPKGMTLKQAGDELYAQHNNEEQVIDAMRMFEGWEWKDVLVAIKAVSEAKFGWIRGITEKTFFGEIRPKEIDVIVDIRNDTPVTVKCFYGKFGISAWDNAEANVGVGHQGCYISIKLKKKYSNDATGYFDAVEQHLQNNSIFKGKTVVVTGGKSAMGLNYDYDIIENKAADYIILNEETNLVIDNFVIGSLGESGKRTHLFVGPYGNGKTETAMKIGRIANNLKMAFFYVKDADLFDTVLNQSKKYQPCIIFVEDIDEVGSGEERDAKMNKILNTLDGVQTKGNDLTVIFTTNHENRINPAMRRPGRISTIVRFMNPAVETSAKIMEQYFRGIDGASELDCLGMATILGDISASVIAEVCKKASKLAEKTSTINNEMVKAAIYSMEYHIKLMKAPLEQKPAERQFVEAFRDIMFTEEVMKKFATVYNNS